MKNKTRAMDFGGGFEMSEDFVLFEKVIRDRGSVYSVSTGRVEGREDIKKFLNKIRNYNKKYQKATHHSYAARVVKSGVVYETKGDDGETGAGDVILRVLKKKDFVNGVVCVTRWFGGVKLEGDRFRHVQDASIFALDNLGKRKTAS